MDDDTHYLVVPFDSDVTLLDTKKQNKHGYRLNILKSILAILSYSPINDHHYPVVIFGGVVDKSWYIKAQQTPHYTNNNLD